MDNRRSFLKNVGLSAASLIPLKLLANDKVDESIDIGIACGGITNYDVENTSCKKFDIKKDIDDVIYQNFKDLTKLLQSWEPVCFSDTNPDWYTTISTGVERNIIVYDADAAPGQFTKRLVSLMKTVMQYTTNLYVSPLVMGDINTWFDDTIIQDQNKRSIGYQQYENRLLQGITQIYGVEIHTLKGLEKGGKYFSYYHQLHKNNRLPKNHDTELIIGLDRSYKYIPGTIGNHNKFNPSDPFTSDQILLGSI